MRPEDLIDAMSMISQDYVTEAKPAPKRHSGSLKQKRDAAGTHESITVFRSNAASGKDYTVKKQSAIQRIMTGIAATAACAVFACGGWFIYKQANQQHALDSDNRSVPDSAASGTDSTVDVQEVTRNFLGGQGEIRKLDHAAHTDQNEGSVYYDDTRWYFRNGTCYAERGSEEITNYMSMPTETAQFLSSLLFDGSRFYHADEQGLYLVENGGTVSEQPFFMLTEQMLEPGQSVSSFRFEPDSIFKMSDDAWLIRMYGDITANGKNFTAVYHANGTVNVLPDGIRYESFVRCGDGSIAAVLSGDSKHDGIVRIGTDGSAEEVTRFSGESNLVKFMSVHDDRLCVLLETFESSSRQDGSGQQEISGQFEYDVIDLNTHSISRDLHFSFDDAPQLQFAFSNGQQDFVVKSFGENSSALFSTDPAWENQQELFRCGASADLPAAVHERLSDAGPYTNIISSAAADENYVMMTFSSIFALYDLNTGSVQYFLADSAPDGNAADTETLTVDESQYNALDPDFTGTNFLGGQGSLHIPKNGSQILWYDDSNYYFPAGFFSRSGNLIQQFPQTNDAASGYFMGKIISDGERLYALKDGTLNLLGSSGTLTPFFRLADTDLAGDEILVTQVFRCGGSIIFKCRCTDASRPGNGKEYIAYVWTDRDGKILSTQEITELNAEFFADTSDSNDGSVRYVYYMNTEAETVIHRLAAPDSGEQQAVFTLPGYDCCYEHGHTGVSVIDDRVFYHDTDGNYCCFDPAANEKKVILTADTPDAEAVPGEYPAIINGKIYYMLTDPFSEQPLHTDIMQYDMNTGEKQKLLSFDMAAINSQGYLSCFGDQLYIYTNDGLLFYNPETGALFRLH